ncbi:MAG TPA: zinc ribbon domain-containing protein [Phycisphaerae bacterium]|nr:zinc ribbon domain-containing protein [Phycisphaerae bacterium]
MMEPRPSNSKSQPTHERFDTVVVKHGRTKDARGRTIHQIDPVKMHLLHQHSIVPSDTLRSMSDALIPGIRKQQLASILCALFTLLFVVGGTVVYFTYFGTWKGLDPVSFSIHIVQAVVIISGPIIVFRMAKTKYAARITEVILEHRHCPHCGYNLRGLPIDAHDGATVCPECGSAWHLPTIPPVSQE